MHPFTSAAATLVGLLLLGGVPVESRAQGRLLPAVRAGDGAVDGRLLQLGDHTLRMTTSTNGTVAASVPIRTVIQKSRAGREPGLLITKTFETPRGTIYDSTLVRRRTLAPLWHHSTQPARRMRFDFAADSVTGAVMPTDSAATPVHHLTEAPAFDSTVMDQVIASLPLGAGYAVRLPLYIYEFGGLVWFDLRTIGSADVAGLDGRREAAWEVELRQPKLTATYWVLKRSHQVVRMEMDLAGGRRVTVQPS